MHPDVMDILEHNPERIAFPSCSEHIKDPLLVEMRCDCVYRPPFVSKLAKYAPNNRYFFARTGNKRDPFFHQALSFSEFEQLFWVSIFIEQLAPKAIRSPAAQLVSQFR
jgi:hypothetical protein